MNERPLTPPGYTLLTNAEYRRLLIAAQGDDTLIWCETCGAWIDHQDPAAAVVDGLRGCWKIATGRPADAHLCRSWRAPDREPTIDDLREGADLMMDALASGPAAGMGGGGG